MKVCLIHIKENEYEVTDCETGKPIELGKNKRAPNAYNLFMKECIGKKTGPVQERFRECAQEYKEQKV